MLPQHPPRSGGDLLRRLENELYIAGKLRPHILKYPCRAPEHGGHAEAVPQLRDLCNTHCLQIFLDLPPGLLLLSGQLRVGVVIPAALHNICFICLRQCLDVHRCRSFPLRRVFSSIQKPPPVKHGAASFQKRRRAAALRRWSHVSPFTTSAMNCAT